MSLFFDWRFFVGWFALSVFIYVFSIVEWNKKGHDKKTPYEHVVSFIVGVVMALAIALSVNAAYILDKYLPDEKSILDFNGGKTKTEYNITPDKTNKAQGISSQISSDINRTEEKTVINDFDKTGDEKDRTNVYTNLTEGSKTFNEFASFFTSPIAIILGFLAILFIIKIETERLHNERRHNRKKAEENLADIAHYAIELLKDFDRRHIDFFIRQRELEEKFGVKLNESIFEKYPDLKRYIINTKQEKYSCETKGLAYKIFETMGACCRKIMHFALAKLKKLNNILWCKDVVNNCTKPEVIAKVYFSQEFVKKLYFMALSGKKGGSRFSGLLDGNQVVDDEILRRIYYNSIASIFAEHVRRKMTDGYSDIGDDVKKIHSLLEDIFLKTDFNMNAPENKCIVEFFLKIEQGIRDFYDIQSGVFIKKSTPVNSKKLNNINENMEIQEKPNLGKQLNDNNQQMNSRDGQSKQEDVQDNLCQSNQDQSQTIDEKQKNVDINKGQTIGEKQKNVDINKGQTIDHSAQLAINDSGSKCDIDFFSKIYTEAMCGILELQDKLRDIRVCDKIKDLYLLSNCEVDDMLDFYRALEKTHKNQFERLFTKMVSDDKAEWRVEKFAELKGFHEQIPSNKTSEEMSSSEKAQRCISILIRIWRECQAYYNYFDLFKTLHELKDAIDNRSTCKMKQTYLTFTNETCENIYRLDIKWFNDTNLCDYAELLKMYFEQHKTQSSEKMYDELFGKLNGVYNGISVSDYTQFLEALLEFIKSSYMEEKVFRDYEQSLKEACKDEPLKSKYEEVFYKKRKN